MEIKNIRIEERLIHGQVATVWLAHLHPDRIIIIDDETSKNDLQKQMLKVACPVGTKLSMEMKVYLFSLKILQISKHL